MGGRGAASHLSFSMLISIISKCSKTSHFGTQSHNEIQRIPDVGVHYQNKHIGTQNYNGIQQIPKAGVIITIIHSATQSNKEIQRISDVDVHCPGNSLKNTEL